MLCCVTLHPFVSVLSGWLRVSFLYHPTQPSTSPSSDVAIAQQHAAKGVLLGSGSCGFRFPWPCAARAVSYFGFRSSPPLPLSFSLPALCWAPSSVLGCCLVAFCYFFRFLCCRFFLFARLLARVLLEPSLPPSKTHSDTHIHIKLSLYYTALFFLFFVVCLRWCPRNLFSAASSPSFPSFLAGTVLRLSVRHPYVL